MSETRILPAERDWSGRILPWAGALYSLLAIGSIVHDPRYIPGYVWLLLGPVWLVQGLARRRARVEVDQDGLCYTAGIRQRRVTWSEVSRIKVDPPGGPRVVQLELPDGWVRLPPLSEADTGTLLTAFNQYNGEGG